MIDIQTRVIKRRKFINPTLISLDIEREMLEQIDTNLAKVVPKKCRNEWIREVISDGLKYFN